MISHIIKFFIDNEKKNEAFDKAVRQQDANAAKIRENSFPSVELLNEWINENHRRIAIVGIQKIDGEYLLFWNKRFTVTCGGSFL